MQQQCYISVKRFSELSVLRLWSSGMCCFVAGTQDTMPVPVYHKYTNVTSQKAGTYVLLFLSNNNKTHRRGLHNIQPMGCMQSTGAHGIACDKFKVCKSMHHHTFQINQPTRCNNFLSLLLDVHVQLNMFLASSRPSSGAQYLQ